MSRNQIFAAVACVAVLLGVAMGFRQAGSPALQRLVNTDEARLNDLNEISTAVHGHYVAYSKLPIGLAQLSRNGFSLRLNDPDTGKPYEYRPLDERRFELCAVFSTDNRIDSNASPLRRRVHGVGRQCFVYPE